MAFYNGREIPYIHIGRIIDDEGADLTPLFDKLSDRVTRDEKRITNLEKAILPDPFLTDGSIAFIKDVPVDALPFAEITKIGGITHRDVENNTLSDTKVTTIESRKKYTIAATSATNLARTVKVENGNISFATHYANWGGAGILFEIAPGTKVDMSWEIVSGTYYPSIIAADSVANGVIAGESTILSNTVTGITSYSFTQAAGKNFVLFSLINLTAAYGATIKNLVVKANGIEVKTDIITTYTIAEVVQALDGYGLGINAEYNNRIEFTEEGRAVFKKTVKKIVLNGTENWKRNDSGYFLVQLADLSTGFTSTGHYAYAVCNRYAESDAGAIPDKCFYIRQNYFAYASIAFRDDSAADLTAWKAMLAASPITLIYSLAAEFVEETDITDLMSVDNLIEVEGGGTITAANANDSAAYTEITYQLKEATA